MIKSDILCCVLNHNRSDMAIGWWKRLSPHFDCVILDSGSNPPCVHEGSVVLPNIYYSGLMNEAAKRCSEGGYKWLMIVTSDIEIDDANAAKLVEAMKTVAKTVNVALYQPSCRWSLRGRALPQSMCHFTGRMRSVNFQEGWFHMMRADLAAELFPIDVNINLFGWGIDLALSHLARVRGQLVIVDDAVKVLHPKGTGYNKDIALEQMRQWHKTIPGYQSPRHFRPSKEPVRFEE